MDLPLQSKPSPLAFDLQGIYIFAMIPLIYTSPSIVCGASKNASQKWVVLTNNILCSLFVWLANQKHVSFCATKLSLKQFRSGKKYCNTPDKKKIKPNLTVDNLPSCWKLDFLCNSWLAQYHHLEGQLAGWKGEKQWRLREKSLKGFDKMLDSKKLNQLNKLIKTGTHICRISIKAAYYHYQLLCIL